MPALVCPGDVTTHGGKVISASSSMFINGILVALIGDRISCPEHGLNRIIEGDSTASEEGVFVVVDNCLCECGRRVISSYAEKSIES